MTFREIILRVAMSVGAAKYPSGADNSPTLPDDPATLSLIKIAINDGREALYSENANRNPDGSARAWSWMRARFSLTCNTTGAAANNIDADASRYTLPDDAMGPPVGKMTFGIAGESGHGAPIGVTTIEAVDAMHQSSPDGSGRPVWAAFVESRFGSEAGRSAPWELRIWPDPDQAYVLSCRLPRRYRPLADLNDIEPCPLPLAVVAYAVYALCGTSLGVDAAKAEQDRDAWLYRLRTHDAATDARSLGQSYDPSVEQTQLVGGAALPYRPLENLFGTPV